MVYTITLNPSLDYYIKIKDLQVGEINRTSGEEIFPGGKGINVSILLSRLGEKTTALGFKAGFTGEEIERLLKEEKVNCDFISCEGSSRINIKVTGNKETQINGDGPVMKKEYLDKLYDKLQAVGKDDVLVLAGSAPRSLGRNVYKDIIEHLPHKETKVVVDAAGGLLEASLSAKPFLVKPNVEELRNLFGVNIRTDEEILEYASKLQDMGAKNVIVSLGPHGGVMLTEEGAVMTCQSPRGDIVNTTGAGDSLVAGFLYKYLESKDMKKSFYMALRCGSATACSSGIAKREAIIDKYKALVLDLDGTLLDTIEDLTAAVNYSLTQYNQPNLSVDEVRSIVGNGIRNLMIRSVPGGEECETFEEEFALFLKYYLDHLYVYSTVYPGMMDVLKRCKELGIPVGIVSNKEEGAVGQIVDHFFKDYIVSYAGDNMVRAKKPAKDSVYAALNQIDPELKAEDVLYVGDSGVDSLTAECAGMDCLLVSWGFRPREELEQLTCMTIIDKAEEIMYFLK